MYGIFTYIWLIFMVNVGEYTSPMDPMGNLQMSVLNHGRMFFFTVMERLAPNEGPPVTGGSRIFQPATFWGISVWY